MGTPKEPTMNKFKEQVPFDAKIFEQFKGYKKKDLDLDNYKDQLSI